VADGEAARGLQSPAPSQGLQEVTASTSGDATTARKRRCRRSNNQTDRKRRCGGSKKNKKLTPGAARAFVDAPFSVRSKKRRAPTRLSVFAKLSCNSLSVIVDHLHPKTAFHLCVAYGLGSQDVPAFRQARGRILRAYRRSYINRVCAGHQSGAHIIAGRMPNSKIDHAVVGLVNTGKGIRHFWDPANATAGWRPLANGTALSRLFPGGADCVYRVEHRTRKEWGLASFALTHAAVFGSSQLAEGRVQHQVAVPRNVEEFTKMWTGVTRSDASGVASGGY
jgi:hypothetical protein